MDVDNDPPSGRISVARDKTTPFLIRTFVKIGGFHRLTLFEDGTLPTTDEHQLFTWKDATLKDLLTTLRNTSPHTAEFKHPLARFSFKTVYADSTNKGRFAQKELGMVYSRDILGEPGSNGITAPRFLEDDNDAPAKGRNGNGREGEGEGEGEGPAGETPEAGGPAPAKPLLTQREREERTLDDLRFVPGDYLLVSVILPKSATGATELAIKGSGTGGNAAGGAGGGAIGGWRSGGTAATNAGPPPGRGGGGGHWRGDSNAPGLGGRGQGGGRGGKDRDRDRDRKRDNRDRDDRRVPPPRRHDSPPPRGAGGRGGRGGRGGAGARSRSRSRSPPPRRRPGRYD